MTTKLLVVDNFDSFTYNLVEYLSDDENPPDIEVMKNTASLAEVRTFDPDAVVLSPGPGHPENDRDVGVTTAVLRKVSPEVPTLGVCLGLEAAVYAYGGAVGRAPEPVHGKAFPVDHDGRGVFTGLEQGFRAGRYHSLVATEVPDCFEVSATTVHDVAGSRRGPTGSQDASRPVNVSATSAERRSRERRGDGATSDRAGGPAVGQREPSPGPREDGPGGDSSEGSSDGGTELVMGIRHREFPIECVQFHPESVLTAVGHDVLRNFLDRYVRTSRDAADPDPDPGPVSDSGADAE